MVKKHRSDNGIMWKICMLSGGLGFAFSLFVYFALFVGMFGEATPAQEKSMAYLFNVNYYLLIGSLVSMVVGRVGGWLLFNH